MTATVSPPRSSPGPGDDDGNVVTSRPGMLRWVIAAVAAVVTLLVVLLVLVGGGDDTSTDADAEVAAPPVTAPATVASTVVVTAAPTTTTPPRTLPPTTVPPEPELSTTVTPPVFDIHAEWGPIPDRPILRVATPEHPLLVVMAGDSMAGAPAWALEGRALDDPLLQVLSDYRPSTGAIRLDFFDWPAQIRTQIDPYRPDVLILSMGGNDVQGFVDGGPVEVLSPEWVEAYGQRVAGILDATEAPGRLVVWVGMPPMDVDRLREAIPVMNAVVQAQVADRPWVRYVDPFPIFGGPEGEFVQYLPDPDAPAPPPDAVAADAEGDTGADEAASTTDADPDGDAPAAEAEPTGIRVREGDGVHYSREGGELLADAILAVIDSAAGSTLVLDVDRLPRAPEGTVIGTVGEDDPPAFEPPAPAVEAEPTTTTTAPADDDDDGGSDGAG